MARHSSKSELGRTLVWIQWAINSVCRTPREPRDHSEPGGRPTLLPSSGDVYCMLRSSAPPASGAPASISRLSSRLSSFKLQNCLLKEVFSGRSPTRKWGVTTCDDCSCPSYLCPPRGFIDTGTTFATLTAEQSPRLRNIFFGSITTRKMRILFYLYPVSWILRCWHVQCWNCDVLFNQ